MAELRPAEILLSEAQIQKRVAEMAPEIRRDFPDDLHVIAVLKGAFIFLSDLVRHMAGHVSLDFMAVSSYAKGTTSSGEVRLLKDLDTPLDGRNVVIVEDIVDTGLTLTYLQDILRAAQPEVAADGLPAEQAVAAQGRRARSNTSASRSRTASSSATASTTPSSTATCRTSRVLERLTAVRRIQRCAPRPGPSAPAGSRRRCTAARSSVRSCRSRISTLPFTIVVRTSSPRVT